MTPAERLHLAGAIRRAPLEIRECIVDALISSGWAGLLATATETPSSIVELRAVTGGKIDDHDEGGAFNISDRSFGHLDLYPDGGHWVAQQCSWHYDSAALCGAGYFRHRLDGLRTLLATALENVEFACRRSATGGRNG